jgi:hypothetical protein
MVKDNRYPKYIYKNILNVPNTKAYDFLYFQTGFGLTVKDKRLKPRFIYACSQFLFDTTKNDPYEQYKDGLAFLKYIFKDKKNLPSRQELANIVSVAQLILYKYEVYKRPLNELSISTNKNVVSKRWNEVFKVDKRKRQLTEARTKVDPKKRIGKIYVPNLSKKDIRERKQQINSNQRWLKKMKKEIEILSHKIVNHQFNSPTKLRNAKEKRDTLIFDIKRLERTLENIDPSVQADIGINLVERHMNAEINQMKSLNQIPLPKNKTRQTEQSR